MSRTQLVIECMKAFTPSRMRGKTIMWWMSFNVVALWWYSAISGHAMDSVVGMTYGAAVAAFAGSKGHELYEQRMSKTTVVKEAGDV